MNATKQSRAALRRAAIRYAMPLVRSEMDWQQVQWEIANEPEFAPLIAGMTDDEADGYTMGIVRFCEHACGFTR